MIILICHHHHHHHHHYLPHFIIITNKDHHQLFLIFGGFHSLAKSVSVGGFLTHLSLVKVVWKILHSICSDNVNVLIFAWVSFP